MKITHIATQKNAWTGKDNSSEPHRLKHQPSAKEFRAQYQGSAHANHSHPKGDQRG